MSIRDVAEYMPWRSSHDLPCRRQEPSPRYDAVYVRRPPCKDPAFVFGLCVHHAALYITACAQIVSRAGYLPIVLSLFYSASHVLLSDIVIHSIDLNLGLWNVRTVTGDNRFLDSSLSSCRPASGKTRKKYLTIDGYIPALNEAGVFRGVATYEKTFEKPFNIQATGFKFLFDPTKEDVGSEPAEAKFDFRRISWDDGTEVTITAKASI
ncbi:hypothetical protein DFS33DRAFT_1377859 [Desarmillaria ectypa]|nr:hypothetical protein DFS33DRAFT_1377859 [Desarmillaria ectypa]